MMKFCVTGKNDKPVPGAAAKTCAIFDAGPSGNDYSAFLNPLGNLSKIAFHSALDYIGVVETIEATVNLPAANYGISGLTFTQEIGTHTQGGRPFTIGSFSMDDGANWFTINGMVFSQIGSALVGTRFIVQADASKIYVFFARAGNVQAETIKFRVHILSRSFGANKPDNGIAFRATPVYVEAGGGIFDTRRNYLQGPAGGQAPDIVYTSGATMLMAPGDEYSGESGDEVVFGLGNHLNNMNVPLTTYFSTSWPPYITQPAKVPLVLRPPGALSARMTFEPGRFRMSGPSGVPVLDTNQKLVHFVTEVKATVSVPMRGALTNDMPHEIVHVSQPVPSGVSMIFGWLEVTSASVGINTFRPNDFSGGMLMSVLAYQSGPSNWVIRAASILYPRIAAGKIEVVEQYYNKAVTASDNAPLPSYSVNVHLFAAALTGGPF